MKNQDFVALFFLFLSVSEAKTFKRCELAQIMKNKGLANYGTTRLQDWVCLANHASKFNTKLVGRPQQGNSQNYGIFQISGRWWCATGSQKPNFGCKMHCKALLNDDITDDIACAKKIASGKNGLNAWAGWKKFCRGTDLFHWIKDCKV